MSGIHTHNINEPIGILRECSPTNGAHVSLLQGARVSCFTFPKLPSAMPVLEHAQGTFFKIMGLLFPRPFARYHRRHEPSEEVLQELDVNHESGHIGGLIASCPMLFRAAHL